ncbi:MAG: phosphate ABC transporter permease PstA [Phycisphaerae bacterium]|nr:phosphate ABC transporter permease PstA [Phycisphaerae bacterium]
MNRRKLEEKCVKGLMVLSTLLIFGTLALILATVVIKGLPALDWAMISQIPKGGFYLGKEGGILNAILGSLYLAGGATLLALILGLPVVLYLNVFARKDSRIAAFTRFSLDVLWGVPSIVFGAFGFIIMLSAGMRASLLGGILTVTLLILPILCRAMDEVIRMVPPDLLEASYAVGATRLQTALKVVVRQALAGILTAVLIAFGRGIGDAASVLFTAGFSDQIPTSLNQPAATLPLAIFFQLGTPFHQVQQRAYASALILTVVILVTSVLSRLLSRTFTRHTIQ